MGMEGLLATADEKYRVTGNQQHFCFQSMVARSNPQSCCCEDVFQFVAILMALFWLVDALNPPLAVPVWRVSNPRLAAK
jgi:hypothetical protein